MEGGTAMKKWIPALICVGAAVITGLVVRQVVQDLSDSAELWNSVTDDPTQR